MSTTTLDLTPPDLADASRPTRLRWALADGVAIAERNLTHVRHVPEQLIDVTVQPVMFVLLFAFVFGSVIDVPGDVPYREFLMAGIFTQTVAFSAATAAVTIADDVQKGVVDRFRSLGVARSAVLVGRAVADLATSALGIAIMALAGLLVGWGIHTSVPEAVAGFALLMLFAVTMQWIGTLIGLLVRAPEAAQGAAFVSLFPLTFVANTFVPTSGLPDGLRQVAEWNPLNAVVAALRELFGNAPAATRDLPLPLEHPVAAAVLWCLGLLAVVVPLAIVRYRSATAD